MTEPPVPVDDAWEADQPVRRRTMVLDVCVAGLLGVLAVAAGAAQSQWSVLAAVLMVLAVAVRRFALRLAVLAAFAAAVVQVRSGDVNVVVDLGFAPVAFALGSHRSSPTRRFGLGYAVVGVVGAAVWGAAQGGDLGLSRSGFAGTVMGGLAAVVLLGGWLTGYLRWQRGEALRSRVAARLQVAEERRLRELVAQEQDRIRIAADMHDVVAHSWAVVAAQADGARYLLRSDPDRAEASLGVIGDTARSAMTDVRMLLARLREAGTPQEGEGLSIERVDALVARMRSSGMALDVRRRGTPPEPTPSTATTRRVLAESLTNALKHGDLSQPVLVEEDWEHGYRLRVENAVSTPPGPSGAGHGIGGMSERVARAGGRMSAAADEDGRHWVVDIQLPVESR